MKLAKIQPEVVKTPEYQIVGGQNKRSKNREWLEVEVAYETKPEEIDELTFKFTILFEKHLLDGEVTYVNIPKDREHYAVMYVPPRALEKLTGGKPITPAQYRKRLGRGAPRGPDARLRQRSSKPRSRTHSTRTGLILNKDQAAPFAPLYYDRYEAIKPASR